MAITTLTEWYEVTRHEIQPGDPVMTGRLNELRFALRMLTRNFAYSNGQIAAISSPRQVDGANKGIPNIGASYEEIARGKIRLWDARAQFRVRALGSRMNVRLIIGGTTVATLALGASAVWQSSASAACTGATIDADGYAELIIQTQRTSTGYVLEQIAVDEQAVASGDYPSVALPSEQGFFALFDEAVAADTPLDAWVLQTIDDMAGRIEVERARAFLHLHHVKRPHKISSVHWRLDGPYMISAPPWADRATVIVTGYLVDAAQGVDICVLSEHERFEDVVGARAQSVTSTTVAHFKFDGIKLRPGGTDAATQLVWIAFRSEIGASASITVPIGAQGPPWKLYCEDLLSSYIPDSSAICGISGVDDQIFQFKNLHRTGSPSSYFDIACVLGEEQAITSTGDSVRQPISISPSPHTGLTSEPAIELVSSSAAGNVYSPSFDVYHLGVMVLTGVFIEARGPDFARRKLARPSGPPSAGLVGEIVDRINQLTRWLTPQLVIRHYGARNMIDDAGNGTNRIYCSGHYIFVPSAGSSTTVPLELPLASDPNKGVTTELIAKKIYCQLCYLVAVRQTAELNFEGKVAFFFGSEDEVIEHAPIWPHAGGLTGAPSPTVADATIASAIDGACLDPVATAPTETTEWAYAQQYTWPPEGHRYATPWRLSPVIEINMPGSFPATLTLNIKNYGGVRVGSTAKTHTTVIVSGLHMWVGPRVPA